MTIHLTPEEYRELAAGRSVVVHVPVMTVDGITDEGEYGHGLSGITVRSVVVSGAKEKRELLFALDGAKYVD